MSELQRQVDALSSKGAKVMLATYPCSKPSAWDDLANGAAAEEDTSRRIDALNGVYREFAQSHPGEVVLTDLNQFTCPEGKFTDRYVDGVRLRDDGLHFSSEGSTEVARWLAPQIVGAAFAAGP